MDVLRAVEMIRQGLAFLEDASAPPGTRGRRFEDEFVQLCRDRGIKASRVHHKGNVDIVANNLRVQAKYFPSATRGSVRLKNGHMLAYDADDFDVLAIKACGDLFIIPSAAVETRRKKMKGKIFLRDIARYRDAWSVIEQGASRPLVAQKEIAFQ